MFYSTSLSKNIFFYLFCLLSLDSLVIPQDSVCHETVGVSFSVAFVLWFLVWFVGWLVCWLSFFCLVEVFVGFIGFFKEKCSYCTVIKKQAGQVNSVAVNSFYTTWSICELQVGVKMVVKWEREGKDQNRSWFS